eukprot:1189809-Prorocentrum_minimum.AAC.1
MSEERRSLSMSLSHAPCPFCPYRPWPEKSDARLPPPTPPTALRAPARARGAGGCRPPACPLWGEGRTARAARTTQAPPPETQGPAALPASDPSAGDGDPRHPQQRRSCWKTVGVLRGTLWAAGQEGQGPRLIPRPREAGPPSCPARGLVPCRPPLPGSPSSLSKPLSLASVVQGVGVEEEEAYLLGEDTAGRGQGLEAEHLRPHRWIVHHLQQDIPQDLRHVARRELGGQLEVLKVPLGRVRLERDEVRGELFRAVARFELPL